MATKRLIDANALIDWLTKYTGFRGNCEDCTDIDCLDCIIENAIKNAPTVDAVEVVRCKDCKNWMYENCDVGLCVTDVPDIDGVQRYADDFCSYGERKDNA